MDRGELEGLDRESLVVRAQAAGIRRARILTRPELIDELLRLDPTADDAQLRKSRGFFGRARDLVARVVERGLHLPDAADRIRTIAMGPTTLSVPRTEPQAMPTVTLAEIYAAQGHRGRAVETLRRVLEREPEHTAARALLARLDDEAYVAPPPPLPPEPEHDASAASEEEEPEAEEAAKDQGAIATVEAVAAVETVEAVAVTVTDAAVDDEDFGDEPTVQLGGRRPPVAPIGPNRAIEGPSYNEANGAEFSLAPASDRLGDEAFDEDPSYAPTRVLPRGVGRTYTFVAPRGEPEVDAHAKTDVFDVLPQNDADARAKSSAAVAPTVPAAPAAPAAPVAPVEEVAEVDECVAIPLGEGRMYARWNVSWSTIGALLGSRPSGRFVVRAFIVTPAWDGPNVETRDLIVDPDDGETTLRALPEPSVVRVAVGWLDGSIFVPLAHSPALEVGRRGLVVWTTKGIVPVILDDPRSAPIARALEASRRVTANDQARA